MATFSIKCPHCLRDNTSFTVIAFEPTRRQDGRANMETFATCNACHRGVCTRIVADGPLHLDQLPGALDNFSFIEVGDWLPKPPAPDVPNHLPETVTKAFMQAEKLRLLGPDYREPSGNAYRRALEAALKAIDATLKGTLAARIEKLAEKGLLTPAMKEFAHRIRTLGNEASHETPLVEEDEIDDLAIFTKLFLLYQFTLPEMLPPKRQ
ncbi:DUF4145 domain-containing protein [Burkholderia gladioli]|uniref:DUF4145 domain-containing protein n=1 Tax=Burkholderia gladioli TaxID=28095 RepID=UPI00164097F4|nr:DUF4145 domain-containing protein [Burkholderia gladioli]